jgi:hypothetical protein
MDPLFSLPPALLALYAEVHYKFRLGFSLLRTDFPEIIADLPWRIDPGQNIRLLCLVKDADRYPILLDEIVATVRWGGKNQLSRSFTLRGESINGHFWHRILEIPRQQIPPGPAEIDVLFLGRRRGRHFRFHNDNYRRLSHAPLKTMLAADPLPNMPGWHPGDPHVHSSFTEDQVEFGAPPEATVQMARAMGLSWTAITDHSYDLDDRPGDPLSPDPQLKKWHQLIEIISQLNNRKENFVTLLGEEVSCGNARNRNVHLLAFGVPTFIPGSGDSAERWLHTEPSLKIEQVLEIIGASGGVAYAGHPQESGSALEKILLRRGSWTMKDCTLPGLSGLQIWNGRRNPELQRGLSRWVRLLLQGKRLYNIGGSDAHGNFSRFRQLRLPFVAMRESTEQIFGQVRTYLYCSRELSQQNLLRALRQGQAVVTDGPLAIFQVQSEQGQRAILGQSIAGEEFTVQICAKSSPEFGALQRIDLHWGIIGGRERRLRSLRRGRDFSDPGQVSLSEGPFKIRQSSYFRLELETASAARTWHALTNPIWLNFRPGAKRGGECPG